MLNVRLLNRDRLIPGDAQSLAHKLGDPVSSRAENMPERRCECRLDEPRSSGLATVQALP
jgi:hypothetical protein